jgi:hypothetical protein
MLTSGEFYCYCPLDPGISPPSIDGDISHTDDLMELDDPEGVVSLD